MVCLLPRLLSCCGLFAVLVCLLAWLVCLLQWLVHCRGSLFIVDYCRGLFVAVVRCRCFPPLLAVVGSLSHVLAAVVRCRVCCCRRLLFAFVAIVCVCVRLCGCVCMCRCVRASACACARARSRGRACAWVRARACICVRACVRAKLCAGVRTMIPPGLGRKIGSLWGSGARWPVPGARPPPPRALSKIKNQTLVLF